MPKITKALTLKDLPAPSSGKSGWPWTEQSELLPEKRPDGSEWPLISVVTPNYNQGEYLEETIRSVLLQGYPNLEYIVIDGGSPDCSVEIIKKYEPFLAHWVSEKDRGQSHGINKGFGRSNGDYIAWMNSSDCYMKGALGNVFNQANESHEFIFGNSLFVGESIDNCPAFTHKEIKEFRLKYILRFFKSSSYIIPSQNVFVSHQLIKRAGFLKEDLHYCMDLEWFARMSLYSPSTLCIRIPFAFYRHHSDAKTSLNSEKTKREAFAIAKEYSKYMKRRERCKLLNLVRYESEYFNYQSNLKRKTLNNLLNTMFNSPKESLSDSRFLGLLKRAISEKIWKNKKRPINSKKYWENRYSNGGNSGPGSYGKLAIFKSEVVNSIIKSKNIRSVIELGCGDGNQISLFEMKKYVGFDVSPKAIEICKLKYKDDKSKEFRLIKNYRQEKADLALSLDVIFHLVEDNIFEAYMQSLFNSSRRHVLIYSSNYSEGDCSLEAKHVRHRKFTDWIEDNISGWALVKRIANKYPYNGDFRETSFADFYLYEKS